MRRALAVCCAAAVCVLCRNKPTTRGPPAPTPAPTPTPPKPAATAPRRLFPADMVERAQALLTYIETQSDAAAAAAVTAFVGDLRALDGACGMTALGVAVQKGHVATMAALAKRADVDPNELMLSHPPDYRFRGLATRAEQLTPLLLAVRIQCEHVTLLLKLFPTMDTSCSTPEGLTALHVAAEYNPQGVLLLLEHGADPTVKWRRFAKGKGVTARQLLHMTWYKYAPGYIYNLLSSHEKLFQDREARLNLRLAWMHACVASAREA